MTAASPAQLDRLSSVPGTAWAGERPAPAPEPPRKQVLLEVRVLRARLQLADAELSYVDYLLRNDGITSRGALEEIDFAMSYLGGVE